MHQATRYSAGLWASACAGLLAAFGLFSAPAQAQQGARAIGAVVAPSDLVAAYSCTSYAEAVFIPKLEPRARRLLLAANDKRAALKRVLSEYDAILVAMCRETTAIFQQHQDKVMDAYARQLTGNRDDIAPFLANPNAGRWASERATFLAGTASLIQYYLLTKSVAPELLSGPRPDHAAAMDVRDTSIGMGDQFERELLILLLADEGFASVAPARFNIATLKMDEVRLRNEAKRLKYATAFGWFNGNASDLVRMHFNGFDVMREIGLAEVYVKYDHVLEEWLRTI
jgi:hypothetical protein